MYSITGFCNFNDETPKYKFSPSTNSKQFTTLTYYDNTYTLIFSGHIYNKKEIKEKLIEKGFEFSSSSDTEILIKAFTHYGYKVVNKLNGAFSFAIWNETKKELYIARDHLGIKPLYYTIVNKSLIFASEIKNILNFPGIKKELDSQSISELFGLGPAHTEGVRSF